MKWVARIKSFGDGCDLSPEFSSARECSEYINGCVSLQVLEALLEKALSLYDRNTFVKGNKGVLKFRVGSFIRPYSKTQHRFADSFDF